MKKTLPIILIVAILSFAGYTLLTKKTDSTITPTNTTTIQEESPSTLIDFEKQDITEQTPTDSSEQIELPGKYVEYTPIIVKESAEQGKKVVLFFHANWCPTCIAANKDIIKRIDEIPENLIIVKTDYDTEEELKKKYNITYQHTFVQVDEDGELITIWNGGDLDEILKRVE